MKSKQTKQPSSASTSLHCQKKEIGGLKKGKSLKRVVKAKKSGKFSKVNNSSKNKNTKEETSRKSINNPLASKNNKRKFDGDSVGAKKKQKFEKHRGKKDEEQPKLEKKELKISRRKKKQNYELTASLIKKYDGLRRKSISSDKKKIMVDEVLDIIAGHGHEVVFKHDTVRVMQMCIKYGSPEQREKLFEQFKENIANLALKKYSKFFVKKMMKYGTKGQRGFIISCFNRKVKKFIRHKEGAEIIELLYNDYANSSQRKFLMQEFYGAEYSVFKSDDARSLDEILETDPHKKPYILKNLKETLSSLIDKSLLGHSIVHKALLDFFTHADEKMRAEMIEAVRESLVTILHTNEGARVTMLCLWHGTPKDRKIIVKSFKTYVSKICQEEYGHLTLLALFDSVDDTVLVQKTIITELISCLDEIVENHYGRKVLLYLVVPRLPAYFSPHIVQLLGQGDNNKYSKKETSLRRKELLSAITPRLIEHVTENVRTMLFDKALSQLFVAIVHNIEGDVEPAMLSVVKLAMKDLDLTTDCEDHVIKSASGHFAIKQLIQLDKKRTDKGSDILISPLLMARVDPDILLKWCMVNRGAFVVVSLLQCSVAQVCEEVKQSLKPCIQQLSKISNKGVEIVLKLLKQ